MNRALEWLALALLTVGTTSQAGLLDELGGGGKGDILPVKEAFPAQLERVADKRLVVTWNIQPGYYLYRDKLAFAVAGASDAIARVERPPGQVEEDPYFGRTAVYREPVSVSIWLKEPRAGRINVTASYQGCAEVGVCYPPAKVQLATAGAGSTAPSPASGPTAGGGWLDAGLGQLTSVLKRGQPLVVIAAFTAAGLLLAFTACLYPMIPILSGLIAGDGQRRTGPRALLLSVVYVESTALTYAAIGVVAGMSGAALQPAFQSPLALGAFAALFVLLALSMFGVVQPRLPAAIRTRLNRVSTQQRGGTLLGVAAMGVLSSLIVGTCSGPALVAALAFIARTGDAGLGALALFALANGMGLPLLLVGTAAGQWLPRSGPWMIAVQRVFGVVFLGVALWLLDRVVPDTLTLGLWGLLLLGCGVFLGGLDRLGARAAPARRLRKAGGLALTIWGAAALVGASSGGGDVVRPLAALSSGATSQRSEDNTLGQFTTVDSVAGLRGKLRTAADAGRPALVDVYADWCVYCVELDEEVFADPRVQTLLADAVLIRVDVTANDTTDKALLRRLGVFLPPAVIFYGRDGQERSELRVVGDVGLQEFMARARRGLYGRAG